MILEEYCNYILSREPEKKDFTIPGSRVIIDKSELLSVMRSILQDNVAKDFDYDELLVNTLLFFVSKEYIGRLKKVDENIDAILNNIRNRIEQINDILKMYKSTGKRFPFSYERIFEILVYYLRILTNILNSDKDQNACYRTAEISTESVLFFINRKLSIKNLDEEWKNKGWQFLYHKDIRPYYAGMVETYIRFVLLSTYIRYCEIKEK